MNHPTLPPALLDRLEPTRRQLRRVIASIKRQPDRADLWREADDINRRLAEIEADFFGKGVTP